MFTKEFIKKIEREESINEAGIAAKHIIEALERIEIQSTLLAVIEKNKATL